MIGQTRRWRPSSFIYGSVLVHLLGLLTLILLPASWPWVVGIIAIDQLLLSTVGLWPRSTLLGPNLRRLPDNAQSAQAVAITIDDGPDPEVTPHVLDLLDRYQAKVTFFTIGTRALQYPELCKEIIRRGHAIENHTHNHFYHFATFGMRRMEREVVAAQQALSAITGEQPLFFRPTAGLRSPLLEPVLARHGLQLVSWTRRGYDTRESRPEKVCARLLRNLKARDILLLHDSNTAISANGQPVILEVLPLLLEALTAANLRSITLRTACT